MSKLGRNDSCPCGSGFKYKKCCLALAEQPAPAPPGRSPLHDQDDKLVNRMLRWAKQWFPEWYHDAKLQFFGHNDEIRDLERQLFIPWALFHYELGSGQSLAHHYYEANPPRVRDEEQVQAQFQAWISVWKVEEVRAGVGLSVHDLLTGQRRFVHEVSGSLALKPGLCILARVLDVAEESVVCGIHFQPLPFDWVFEVLNDICDMLEGTVGSVSPSELRGEDVTMELIDLWRQVIEKSKQPPDLRNTDGDALLITEDTCGFLAADRKRILQAMRAFDMTDEAEGEAGELVFVVHRTGNRMHADWSNTVIGNVRVSARDLCIETNSTARADALWQRVQKACGNCLLDRARTQTDPYELRAKETAPRPASVPSREELGIIRDAKRSHYESWLDQPLPALGGATPRQAVAQSTERWKVEMLLEKLAGREAAEPPERRYDVTHLYDELSLQARETPPSEWRCAPSGQLTVDTTSGV